jgi:hypothetical protein
MKSRGVVMFVSAVQKAWSFTHAIDVIRRRYGSSTIEPGTATVFFVNDRGWAVTSREVGKLLLQIQDIATKRDTFLQELTTPGDETNQAIRRMMLEGKYGYTPGIIYEASFWPIVVEAGSSRAR